MVSKTAPKTHTRSRAQCPALEQLRGKAATGAADVGVSLPQKLAKAIASAGLQTDSAGVTG